MSPTRYWALGRTIARSPLWKRGAMLMPLVVT